MVTARRSVPHPVKDKYQAPARNFAYAFMRGGLGPVLHDLVTYTVISDVLRGLPAIYALYSAYDDLAHFAGMYAPEAFEELYETDRYFARVEAALKSAPRPYHVVILSDHGQTIGPQFKAAYGCTLEELVKDLIKEEIAYSDSHKDNWDAINAVANESANDDTRTAGLLRRMLASRTKEGAVELESAPVGDCAGRGADLFESTAAENVGAMILGIALFPVFGLGGILFPLLARAFGLIATIVGVYMVSCREDEDPMNGLNRGYLVTTVLAMGGFAVAVYGLLSRLSHALLGRWHDSERGSAR